MARIHARGYAETDFYSALPLYINNCGSVRNSTVDEHVLRPRGRCDYHLIFNVQGCVTANGKTLGEGEVYFFPPRVKQDYTYLKAEKNKYYWIHFSGGEVPSLLSGFPPVGGKIDVKENVREIEELIRLMIRAFTENWTCADEYAAGLFRSLLALIVSPKNAGSPFAAALRKLGDPSDNVSVKELADMYKMSEGNFIRQFRAFVGTTPHAYRLARKIEVAKDLLADTDLPIFAVAESVNVGDPLYFTRLFTQKTGLSPSEYRKTRAVV